MSTISLVAVFINLEFVQIAEKELDTRIIEFIKSNQQVKGQVENNESGDGMSWELAIS